MLLLWILFVIYVSCLSLICFHVCSWQTCDHLLWKDWPLGSLVCDVPLFFFHFYLRCGTLLYRFLIFAFLLTFFCLFVWFDSLRPINNLSVKQGRSYARMNVPCSRTTTQWGWGGSNPQPLGLESSSLPLSHCAPYCLLCKFVWSVVRGGLFSKRRKFASRMKALLS